MESLCSCGHEPTGSIVPVSELVILLIFFLNFIRFRSFVRLHSKIPAKKLTS